MRRERKTNRAKVYCEKCDSLFESREEFEQHFERHVNPSCESCPLDTAISKLIKLFKR